MTVGIVRDARLGGPGSRPKHGRRKRSPWGAGVALSIVLHAAPLIAAGGYWATRPTIVQAPEQVFEVELVRLQAPPQPPSEQPPGPVQTEAASSEARPQPTIQPRIPPANTTHVEPLVIAPSLPRLDPAVDQQSARETTAPPSRPAPPAASAASADQTWEGRVIAHLERRKRYPSEARSRRLQGVTYIRFTMDREGRVVSVSVDRTSGHDMLDREALALLNRAQPLPKPPAAITGDRLSLSVPVEFFLRGR